MQKFKYNLNKALEIVCIALFVFITIIGSYQIITRYVFNSPSTVSEELLTYSFTWLALLSASLVFAKREHMRMGYLADKLQGNSKHILAIIVELLVLIFSALILVYGGLSITKLTKTQVTASLGIQMAYIYAVVPISGVLTIIYNFINICETISILKSSSSKQSK